MPIDIALISNMNYKLVEIHNWREIEGESLQEDDWKKVTHVLTEETYKNNLSDLEIYLIFRCELLICDFENYGFIEKIFESVINFVWGVKAYVVIDRTVEQIDGKNLQIFSELALKYQICDIFEVGSGDEICLREPEYLINIRKILNSIDTIKTDRSFSIDLISGRGWDCVIPKDVILPDENMIPFGTKQMTNKESNILVYCSGNEKYTNTFIKKIIQNHPDQKVFLANLNNCLNNALKKNYQLAGYNSVEFYGNVDLTYSLWKLNQRREPRLINVNSCDPRKVRKQFSFETFNLLPPPRLLITNAFTKAESLCHLAAKEAGSIKRLLSVDAEVEIRSGINFDELPNILDNNPLTIWLFQGHGEKDLNRLKDFSWNYHNPEQLFTRFNSYRNKYSKEGLPMVFFASCYSASFAEYFASHGVAVTIGFESEVTSFETQIVAEVLIPKAIKTRDKKGFVEYMKDAFSEATNALVARNLGRIKPVMYYANY
jgi:hypothetical protein